MTDNKNGDGTQAGSLTVTSAAEWRRPREQGVPVRLPCGMVASLRPVSPDELMVSGQVPDLLTPMITGILFDGTDAYSDEMEKAASKESLLDNTKGAMDLINLVNKLSFVQPKVVFYEDLDKEERGLADDEILIYDVPVHDRGVVFSLALQGVDALKTFPPQQNAGDATGQGEQAVRSTAKRQSRRNK